LENQLVNYKLLFAEKSSKLIDTEDYNEIIIKKYENLKEKILVKDDIIKNLILERDSYRQSFLNLRNLGTNNINCSQTQRPYFDSVNNNYNNPNTVSNISEMDIYKNNKNTNYGVGIILDGNKSILSKYNNSDNDNNNNDYYYNNHNVGYLFEGNNKKELGISSNKEEGYLQRQKNISNDINNNYNSNFNYNNTNNNIDKRHNSCTSTNDYFNNIANTSNVNYSNSNSINQKTLKRNKSNGILGSIKNLFSGEKGKK
jgi:hypothetical protein